MTTLALASILFFSDRPNSRDWTLLKTLKGGNVASLRKYLSKSVRLRMVVDRNDLKDDDHKMISDRFSESQQQALDWDQMSMGTITASTKDSLVRQMLGPFREVLILRKASEKDLLDHGVSYISNFAPEGQEGFMQFSSPSKLNFIYIISRKDQVPKLTGLETDIRADGYSFSWFNKPPNT